MRAYLISGPHEGQTLDVEDDVTELLLPHPEVAGRFCRYIVNDSDRLVGTFEAPKGRQFHHIGTIVDAAAS